jgi:Zn-dependent peptidase ImmA (M78 family)
VAWAFTVLHELAHLWLGATGVSGGSSDTQIESYCNTVAGEILLPGPEMNELRFLSRASLPETIEAVARFARMRNISRPMVAYKLLRLGFITHKNEGGPSYYVVKRHRLGRALLVLVANSLAEGFLTHTKAGRVLGVNPRNVDPLIHIAGLRGSQ